MLSFLISFLATTVVHGNVPTRLGSCGLGINTVSPDEFHKPLDFSHKLQWLKGLSDFMELQQFWWYNWNSFSGQAGAPFSTKFFVPTQWDPNMEFPVSPTNPSEGRRLRMSRLSSQLTAPLFFGWNEPDLPGSGSSGSYQNDTENPGQVITLSQDPSAFSFEWKRFMDESRRLRYKHTASPATATGVPTGTQWMETFAQSCHAQGTCPDYLAFHFYADDCPSATVSEIAGLRERLSAMADIHDAYNFKGMIINEFGILSKQKSCQQEEMNQFVLVFMETLVATGQKWSGKIKHVAWFEEGGPDSFSECGSSHPMVDKETGEIRAHGHIFKYACAFLDNMNNV